MARYIFVSGGVVSSVGKGITVASLGRLLKSRGVSVSLMKLDPYINVDPGTMSPYQHGEVFVTDDGAETDLDLGHYERFVDLEPDQASNVTTGRIYTGVIGTRAARRLPGRHDPGRAAHHQRDQGAHHPRSAEQTGADVVIVEVGGTVGDIECLPFLEAIRQMHRELAASETLFIHVTLLPYVGPTKELKTKPTQHSVKELRSIGIQPDVIVAALRLPGAGRPEGQDRAVLRRRPASAWSRWRRPTRSTRCRWSWKRPGWATSSSSGWACRQSARPGRVARHRERAPRPSPGGPDRRRRQVRRRSKTPTSACASRSTTQPGTTTCGVSIEWIDSEQLEERRLYEQPAGISTASSCRAASATAASRA